MEKETIRADVRPCNCCKRETEWFNSVRDMKTCYCWDCFKVEFPEDYVQVLKMEILDNDFLH
jgi:hypothetical protein